MYSRKVLNLPLQNSCIYVQCTINAMGMYCVCIRYTYTYYVLMIYVFNNDSFIYIYKKPYTIATHQEHSQNYQKSLNFSNNEKPQLILCQILNCATNEKHTTFFLFFFALDCTLGICRYYPFTQQAIIYDTF